jgi:hypothetical protein
VAFCPNIKKAADGWKIFCEEESSGMFGDGMGAKCDWRRGIFFPGFSSFGFLGRKWMVTVCYRFMERRRAKRRPYRGFLNIWRRDPAMQW